MSQRNHLNLLTYAWDVPEDSISDLFDSAAKAFDEMNQAADFDVPQLHFERCLNGALGCDGGRGLRWMKDPQICLNRLL